MNSKKLKMVIVFILTFMLSTLCVKAISKSYKVGDKITYNPEIFVKELNINKFKSMEIINN